MAGRGLCSLISHFTIAFCLSHIFGNGEARHLKFSLLIDTQECLCMRDILSSKGTCDVSRDFFKFWEISDNISLSVQDRDR